MKQNLNLTLMNTLVLEHLPHINSQVYECTLLSTNNYINLFISAQKERNHDYYLLKYPLSGSTVSRCGGNDYKQI